MNTETPESQLQLETGRGGCPVATVIVTSYNYGHFLESCLESVYRQDIADIDLVVVDDRSQDQSVCVLEDWMGRKGTRFCRARLYLQPTNRGLAASRNACFRTATTEYVMVLDADNQLYPRCVGALCRALDNCDATFAYPMIERFDERAGLISTLPWDVDRLRVNNYIDAMAMIRRSAWQRAGGYWVDDDLPTFEDYDLWIRIAKNGGWGVRVPEILARYRDHGASLLHDLSDRYADLRRHLERQHPTFFNKRCVSPSSHLPHDENFTASQIDQLQQQLQAIYNTRLWRWSAPLRRVWQSVRSTARLR